MAGRVAHAVGHDEHIARVLVQLFVGLEDQRVRARIPRDLIDPDPLAEAVPERVSPRLIRNTVSLSTVLTSIATGKRHRDARLHVKPSSVFEDIDVRAVRRPRVAVGFFGRCTRRNVFWEESRRVKRSLGTDLVRTRPIDLHADARGRATADVNARTSATEDAPCEPSNG